MRKPLLKSALFFMIFIVTCNFFACKKNMSTPSASIPAMGKGSFVFDGTTYTSDCSIFDSSSVIPGRLNEITLSSTMYQTGYSPEFIISYMPVEASGTFPFAATTSVTPFQSGTVFGTCFIIKGMGSSGIDYYVQSGTLTKTAANSFSFDCIMYQAGKPSITYKVTGAGTY